MKRERVKERGIFLFDWQKQLILMNGLLCLVDVSTEYVEWCTRIQEWTCVHHLTCPVEISTRHKPSLIGKKYTKTFMGIWIGKLLCTPGVP